MLEVATVVGEGGFATIHCIHPVLEEIDDLMLVFQEFLFSYTCRDCNKVAHVVAKQDTGTYKSEMWHVTPPCFCDLVL